ncbi:MAG: hypothetical protein M3Z08_03330 [Chloroflexota bacterium]|nr:hypothetical protein [Chloroflexota bacterium]
MASKVDAVGLPLASIEEKTQQGSNLRFDWAMVVVSIWWLGGLFIDGWAHNNIPQLESFFTPWHAVLYSGYLAVAITLIVKIVQNLQQSAASASTSGKFPSLLTIIKDSLPGKRWMQAIPTGYELSLLGMGVFLISGIGDLTWHLMFGIERSTEALLSPTHLGLALGVGFALSGPLRAAWRRAGDVSSWRQLGPAIFSLTFTFSLLTFFTGYASPLINSWPIIPSANSPTLGITGILLETGLIMSFVLLALRRWRLPFGAFTFMFTLNGALMAALAPDTAVISIPTMLLAGLAADLLYKSLQPSLEQPASVRLFVFLVPAILYLLYFVDLAIVGPILFKSTITWTIPFWAGTPVIAGIAGFLLSYVMIPPAQSAEKKEVTL